jgi:hypothetical protein
MASVRRRLLNLLTLMSLLLSVAVAALWVRSYWGADWVEYGTADAVRRLLQEYNLHSEAGVVSVTWRALTFERSEALAMYAHDRGVGLIYGSGEPDGPTAVWSPLWQSLGFDADSDSETRSVTRYWQNPRAVEPLGKMTEHRTTVTFPHWFAWLVLLAAGWPAVRRVIRFATAKTRDPGNRCRNCAYDLRASPDRCPECGAAP